MQLDQTQNSEEKLKNTNKP